MPLLTAAFEALDAEGVPWVVLRGDEENVTRGGDMDVLVAAGTTGQAARALQRVGFVTVPSGEDPHVFFLGRGDGPTWVGFDVYEVLTAGDDLLPASLAREVLGRRVRADDRWLLDPDDEFWYFLLHQAEDRRGRPVDVERLRLKAGSARAQGPVARTVAEFTPGPPNPEQVLEVVRRDPASVVETLRRSLSSAQRRRSTKGVATARRLGSASHRTAQVLRSVRRPNGVSVAILGPDGAGKTTLADGLSRALPVPTRYVYLGVWRQYEWDHWLRLVVGARLLARLLRLSWRSVQVMWHRGRGRVVLLDRFTYDALLPSEDLDFRGRITVALIRQLGSPPDLVLVLDTPAEVMFARKGEQGVEVLERQRLAYLEIAGTHPHCVVINADRPAPDVLAEAQQAIWQALVLRWQPDARSR